MKRTVYNTMIGLMLACGLAMTSTGAMAQGRRPATNTNAAAAGNRSVATAQPKNNAATVTNNNNSAARSTSGNSMTARPVNNDKAVVNRPATSTTPTNAGNRSVSGSSTVRPNVGGSSSSGSSSGSSSRPSTQVINHGNSNSGSSSTVTRPTGTTIVNAGNRSSSSSTNVRPNISNDNGTKGRPTGTNGNNGNGNKPNGGHGNNGKPDNGGNGNHGGNGKPNSGSNMKPNTGGNGTGHTTAPTHRPSNRPKIGGTVMNGGGPKIDYSAYRYNNNWRPRHDGDRFYNSYRYNSWSWASPIRPTVRPWRPRTMWVYRPIVTVNVTRYSSYPTIGGVLGLTWGTSFSNCLNYLYYSGYYIDGYMDNIVYITDVNLLGYDWDDVMLQFNGNDNLDYVEFVSFSEGYNTSRFYSLYNYLCSMYGSPVSYNNAMYSWYGGDGIGYVNLGLQYTADYNYTVLAFGI